MKACSKEADAETVVSDFNFRLLASGPASSRGFTVPAWLETRQTTGNLFALLGYSWLSLSDINALSGD